MILCFQEAPKAGKQMKEENVLKYFTLKYKEMGWGGVCMCVDVLNGACTLLTSVIGEYSSL